MANRLSKRSNNRDGTCFQPVQESKALSEPERAPLPTPVLSTPCAESPFWEEKWDHLTVCGSDFNNQASHFLNSWFLKAVALFKWGFALRVWLIYFFLLFCVYSDSWKSRLGTAVLMVGWTKTSLSIFNTPHRVIVCEFSINSAL